MSRRLTFFSLALCALVASGSLLFHLHRGTFLVEYHIYLNAAQHLNQGATPYDINAINGFLYPPHVLNLFAFLARTSLGPWESFSVLYIIAFSASVALTPLLVHHLIPALSPEPETQTIRHSPILLTYTAWIAFFGAGGSAWAANAGFILYTMILAGCLFACKTQRWTVFYLIMLLVASVKVHYFVFILLPLPLRWQQPRFWGEITLTTLALAAVYGALLALYPKSMHDLIAIIQHAFNAFPHVGWSVYGLTRTLIPESSLGPLAIHISVSLGLMTLFFVRKHTTPLAAHAVIPLWIIILTLTNPKVAVYDFSVASIPCLYLLLLELGHTRTHKDTRLIGGMLAMTLLIEGFAILAFGAALGRTLLRPYSHKPPHGL